MARERLISLIRESGRTPVERDCLYETVKVFSEEEDPVPALI
jgi:2-iminoacetate synthase ThiH